MRKLDFPADMPDPLDFVRDALAPSTVLNSEEEDFIIKSFAHYLAVTGFAHRIDPDSDFNARYGDIFRAAYSKTHEGRKLDHVRNIFFDSAGNRCPFCGGTRPNQLDHHLPQDQYGEFAVYIRNLVPICGDCNKKKSDYVSTSEDDALFHPYLDQIPDVRIFRCEAVIDDDKLVVRFALDLPDNIDTTIKRRFEFQYSRIDINYNLRSEISEVITEYIDILRFDHVEADQDKIRRYLNSEADRFERVHYKAFWKVAFLRALARNGDFCAGAYKAITPQNRRHTRRGLT